MRIPFAIRAAVLTVGALGLPVPGLRLDVVRCQAPDSSQTQTWHLIGHAAAAQSPPPLPIPRGSQVPPLPPRDPARQAAPEPVGTAVIRGTVVTSDTGSPVRRASVTLMPVATPAPLPTGTPAAVATARLMNGVPVQAGNTGRPKSATTDAQGAFAFTALPAGSYRVTASAGQFSAAYLGMAYGAKKPSAPGSSDLGTPIQVSDGQMFEKAVIALPRGGVITGRVTDENGDALARVQVYTMFFQAGSARGRRMGSTAATDDLGQFRLFGLTPGEYNVVAEARGNTFVQPNAPPETEEDKVGFMMTYYPGTPDEGAAARVRARAGAETPGIEIRMVTGRLFHVSGMVTDSQGRPAARTSGNLWKRLAGSTGVSTFGFSTDEQGRFQMRSIPPGNYRLAVQQRPVQFGPDGSRSEPGEVASLLLTIASDVDNLMVSTSPGATIIGQILFEQGPPSQMPQGIRVSASPANPEDTIGMPPPQPAVVTPDLTFTMKGMSGEYVLRTSAPNQFLKAVMLGADEITDNPREFKTGDKVTLVLTSRASTLEGNVTDATGKPSADAALLVFSEDKALWRMNSLRTKRSIVAANGHYHVTGLMPGRYFAAAVSRDRLSLPPGGPDTAFFEQLAKEATSFVIGEDEQRQVDLRVIVDPGGV